VAETLEELLRLYHERKNALMEQLRNLGVPEKLIEGKSVEQLEDLLDRYDSYEKAKRREEASELLRG
jgi:hypothetical protein